MGTQTQSICKSEIYSNSVKPWQDQFGKNKPQSELKTISKNWSPQIWEEYLASTEGQLSESQLSPSNFDEMAESQTENIFYFSELSADDELKAQIKSMLNVLTKKQRQVTEMIFWGNKSERQIAKELNICKASVRDFKKFALKRLVATFRIPPTSPLMRGKMSSLDKTGGEDAKASLTVAKSNSYEEVRP